MKTLLHSKTRLGNYFQMNQLHGIFLFLASLLLAALAVLVLVSSTK